MIEWWNSLIGLEKVFAYIAIPATLIMIIQIILLLIGMDGHGDADVDADGDIPVDSDGDPIDGIGDGLRLFTVRGVIIFFAIFGWSGLLLLSNGAGTALSIILAVLFGSIALVLTAYAMKLMMKLQYDGTVKASNTIGKSGTVYLTIPAERTGKGKVSIVVQEVLSEFDAMTDNNSPLLSGSEVVVLAVTGENTLIVAPKQ